MLLNELPTPALVLDRARLRANCDRMAKRMRNFGVDLRPHMKTAKSWSVAGIATRGFSGALTVSTLQEAEYFIELGARDVTYAIGIPPEKLERVASLQRNGATVNVLTDDVEVARTVARKGTQLNVEYSVLIDIDVGYGRSGLLPDAPEVVEIARILHDEPGARLAGVLTHAGHAYEADGLDGIRHVAADERDRVTAAAERIRAAGYPCPIVSLGSTPSCSVVDHLEGVTEARPGNYMFYDLMMVERGVCQVRDIAVSVLASVIVARPERNHAVFDAGGLALSKDTGANRGSHDGVGYGLVCDALSAQPLPGVIVKGVSQEHGRLGMRDPAAPLPEDVMHVGRKFRILPNHSCMTAAAYDRYYVVDGDDRVVDIWNRTNGW
jgi:D-serine deaminase-like pyridoxal phosphate-dependent protein